MKHRSWIGFCSVAVGLLAWGVVVLSTGCEEAEGTASLTVEPAFVDLTAGTVVSNLNSSATTQTFTVTEDSLRSLSLPLIWSVSNPSLGTISYSGGRSASYVRSNARGDNAILVEDQYGARGTATVRQ